MKVYSFYLFSFFFIFVHNCWGSADADWRIGFEFEMPYIGVINEGPGPTPFPKETILEGDNWILMRDTLDSKVRQTYVRLETPGAWNLEFKTKLGGLALADRGTQIATIQEIQEVISQIILLPEVDKKKTDPSTFAIKMLDLDAFAVQLKAKLRTQNIQVGETLRGKTIRIALKDSERFAAIRPQLTIQLPLSKVPAIFHHLYVLGSDHRISYFFHPLSSNDRQAIQKEKIVVARHVGGLRVLFDFYVERFFMKHDEREPGPKPAFPIMSRLCFRDMYSRLPEEDKRVFRVHMMKKYTRFPLGFVEKAIQLERFLALRQEAITSATERFLREAVAFGFQDLLSVQALSGLPRDVDVAHLRDIDTLKEQSMRTIDDLLPCEYGLNSIGMDGKALTRHDIKLSIKQILTSIADPAFRCDVMNDERRQVPKISDYFSTPFEGLAEDYSMGALPYPLGATQPIAILELRSYTKILGEVPMDKILDFFQTEALYMIQLMNAKSPDDIQRADLENLQAVSILQGQDPKTAVTKLDERLKLLYNDRK